MKILKEFRDFAIKGNAIDLAVGVVIGAAFGKIVSSLVEDVIMPPLSFIIGKVDFSDLVWKIAYDGKEVVLMNYGKFLNNCVSFVIVAWAIFLLVKLINHLKKMAAAEAAQVAASAPPPAPSKQELLLAEIRDLLKK